MSRIDRELALATVLDVAWAAYHAAVAKYPGRVVTLRQRARILGSTERDR